MSAMETMLDDGCNPDGVRLGGSKREGGAVTGIGEELPSSKAFAG
jgi:hypothetical protein